MANKSFSSLRDLEEIVQRKCPDNLFEYYVRDSEDEQTLQDSMDAFMRFRLKPRVLRSRPNPSLGIFTQGRQIELPFGISPTAFQGSAHPDGESGTAKAAEEFGAIMIVSSISQTTIEDIRKAAPNAHLWMQTYIFKNRNNTYQLAKRAEKLGFEALVVTVDSPVFGRIHRPSNNHGDITETFEIRLANLSPSSSELAEAISAGDRGLVAYTKNEIQSSYPQWEDIAWLKSITSLPVILKGIVTDEDALDAVKAGVQGIIVSAHGGRQLDGIQAPIEALPSIVSALQDSGVEVYMDGGVRSGRDVVKALALGAKAVFMGRSIVWGLMLNGEKGVKDVLKLVRDELINTMSLCGCNQISDITRSLVEHESRLLSKL